MGSLKDLVAKQKNAQAAKPALKLQAPKAASPVGESTPASHPQQPKTLKLTLNKTPVQAAPATEQQEPVKESPPEIETVPSRVSTAESLSAAVDISAELDGCIAAGDASNPQDGDAPDAMAVFAAEVKRVEELFEEPELLSQVLRTIMVELQEHPEFEEVMSAEDIGMMSRAMRDVLGLASIKKAAAKRKTSGGTSSRSKKKELDPNTKSQLDALFAGMKK